MSKKQKDRGSKKIILGKKVDKIDKICPKCDSPMSCDGFEWWVCTNKDCEYSIKIDS